MHIVVCIKQVPETQNVRIDPETNTLVRQGVASMLNPFDYFALEAALRLKDHNPEIRITAVTMGPPQAKDVLIEALSRGVDDAVLLSHRAFAGADTWATSYTLAAAIRKLGPVDLVICGKQAVDGDTAQVGPELATILDIPYATCVKGFEPLDGGHLKVVRQTDEGMAVWKLPLPALITVLKDVGNPRPRSYRATLRARRYEIPVWGPQDLNLKEDDVGLRGSFTQVIRVFSPERKGDRIILEGSIEQQVEQLYEWLKSKRIPGL
ncbi:electron transfer flavoprotein subunit beta/FixA family protein [Thermodesulforhabdus norvegica]|uniref:Electron transfer flavoprotein beta subunit n=1 Tax=Thermodesulforhabdus norvegica TaxID=39841 RepID=A0A1I4SXJ9_9BACT|nr:electron transfer flavoprotein subunit beta/FixA family protein [Thermodesulforhabdus norvegica]SFM69127.1 electron transfer flavoprotein beta subunit [Thermodesulforhabdus norvegica]